MYQVKLLLLEDRGLAALGVGQVVSEEQVQLRGKVQAVETWDIPLNPVLHTMEDHMAGLAVRCLQDHQSFMATCFSYLSWVDRVVAEPKEVAV
jgi:hypothetical protein